jgi:hypothetical protein
MRKNLSSFANMFKADTGMDTSDEFVSAWSDALVASNSKRNRKFIATDVDNWLHTMTKEIAGMDDSLTVDVWFDSENDLLCASMIDAGGCSEFCVATPRSPKTKREKLVLSVVNGGQGALEVLRESLVGLKNGALAGKSEPAVTESDKSEEHANSVLFDDELSDDQLEKISDKLDKTASLLANNQAAAYLVELAASRIRELKNG